MAKRERIYCDACKESPLTLKRCYRCQALTYKDNHRRWRESNPERRRELVLRANHKLRAERYKAALDNSLIFTKLKSK